MNDKLIKLGLNIKKFRVQLGLSQEELADKSELHRTYIGMLERGQKNPTILTLFKISKALKINLSKILENLNDN